MQTMASFTLTLFLLFHCKDREENEWDEGKKGKKGKKRILFCLEFDTFAVGWTLFSLFVASSTFFSTLYFFSILSSLLLLLSLCLLTYHSHYSLFSILSIHSQQYSPSFYLLLRAIATGYQLPLEPYVVILPSSLVVVNSKIRSESRWALKVLNWSRQREWKRMKDAEAPCPISHLRLVGWLAKWNKNRTVANIIVALVQLGVLCLLLLLSLFSFIPLFSSSSSTFACPSSVCALGSFWLKV